MPIVDVTVVGDDALPPGLNQALADGLGAALASPPGRLWLRLHRLPAERYAENGGGPAGALPVFVTLLQADAATEAARRQEAARLAAVVGTALERPVARVHVEYALPGRGRMAFGGDLLT